MCKPSRNEILRESDVGPKLIVHQYTGHQSTPAKVVLENQHHQPTYFAEQEAKPAINGAADSAFHIRYCKQLSLRGAFSFELSHVLHHTLVCVELLSQSSGPLFVPLVLCSNCFSRERFRLLIHLFYFFPVHLQSQSKGISFFCRLDGKEPTLSIFAESDPRVRVPAPRLQKREAFTGSVDRRRRMRMWQANLMRHARFMWCTIRAWL